MLLSLVSFPPWGPVGLSLEESSQMTAPGEGLIYICYVNNSFLGITICTVSETSFLKGRLIN